MSDDDAPGFFSRWSQRKAQHRQVAVQAPAAVELPPPAPAEAPVAEPPPTLADVAALDANAPDFSRFVAQGVAPDVKNAALKKLFADPHFNVMDGLDTYIDDYGKPDPLPAHLLRQMAQSQFLGLVQDEPDAAAPESPPLSLQAAADEDPDLRLQPDDAAGRSGAAPEPGNPAGRQS